MQIRLLPFVLALGFLVPCRAHAQTIDQQNSSITPGYGFADINSWTGQTFRPTSNTIVGAGVYVENWFHVGPQSGLLDVLLWSGVPTYSSGVLLAHGHGTFATGPSSDASLPNGGMWADVFWPAVSVTPGEQYFLAFRGDRTLQTVFTTFTAGNSYTDGTAYYGTDYLTWSAQNNEIQGIDLNFREYSALAVTSTPEPASILLLATGLAGMLGVARRKRHGALTSWR